MAEVVGVSPDVALVAFTDDPYGITVASARTCYAKDFVLATSVGPAATRQMVSLAQLMPESEAELDALGTLGLSSAQQDAALAKLLAAHPDHAEHLQAFLATIRTRQSANERIAQSIYEAGHHTPFQHPTFVFKLAGVSRNVVESFFHQHMFFNSEQQSQRYVEMAAANVVIPEGLSDAQAKKFRAAISDSWDAYHHLRASLVEVNRKTMTAIGKIKGQTDAQIVSEAEKKAQEMARYVVPIAAATQLYHTVSGVVLLRYVAMANSTHAGPEARAVVAAMVDAVAKVDPDFGKQLREESPDGSEFDLQWSMAAPVANVDGMSQLVDATSNAKELVVRAIRDVTGASEPSDELLAKVLDPGTNPSWTRTLNVWDHSMVLRALRHVRLTYRKTISLSAFAQDQRHRLTPATRPLLHQLLTDAPNVYVPDVLDKDPDAKQVYLEACENLWRTMLELKAEGAPIGAITYLLPNATNMTYLQSGDLLAWMHKWRLRLCFNAQKEIFDASVAELAQAKQVMPELLAHVGPPCLSVSATVPADGQDDPELCCPEGPRWCGVKVWKNFDAVAGKPRRPY